MLYEFWNNFTHNLFKPLLLFFYMGFLIPLLKIPFEFPYVLYQGLTLYLLLAIGWHGGEQLATIDASSVGGVLGFIVLGFLTNLVIGFFAYWLLSRVTKMRGVDRATVAGYYGSDSAGTFATCLGVLTTLDIAFDAYMPVMLAIMEIPGCIVALVLVARMRARQMDPQGNLPGEPAYNPTATRQLVGAHAGGGTATITSGQGGDDGIELPGRAGSAAHRIGRHGARTGAPGTAARSTAESGTVPADRWRRHRFRQCPAR